MVLFPPPLLLASLEGQSRHLVFMATSCTIDTLGLTLFANVHPVS